MNSSADYTGTLATFPYAPGESPFRIKGVAYKGHVARGTREAGNFAAFVARFNDPAMKTFWQQPFLAASFYDVMPMVASTALGARAAGRTLEEHTGLGARQQVREDMTGVYKFVLKILSPNTVASRLAQLTGQYTNFGAFEVLENEAAHVAVLRTGIPEPMLTWAGPILEHYTAEALVLSGAKGVRTKFSVAPGRETRQRVAIASMRCDYYWD